LAVFVGIYQHAAWRNELEICLCTLHLFGNAVFVIPELLTGCLNMVPIGVKGCHAGMSAYELFFFWFAVGINGVWVVVPIYCLVTTVGQSVSKKQGGKKLQSAANGHIKSGRRAMSKSPKPKGA